MLKRFLAYSLTLAILVATLYVPVFVHTCFLFDVTKTSVFTKAKCCVPQGDDHHERIDVNCCSLEIKTFKAEITPHLSDQSPDVPVIFAAPMAITHWSAPLQNPISHSSMAVRPPPTRLHNRTLHTAIQVFRI